VNEDEDEEVEKKWKNCHLSNNLVLMQLADARYVWIQIEFGYEFGCAQVKSAEGSLLPIT
jgi:hypothetical protein